MEQICGIYKITNLINDKIYIGQSVNIKRRWAEEKSRALDERLHEVSALYAAIAKYGKDNFSFEIIEVCNPWELNDREAWWIQFYNSMSPNGYNLIAASQQVTPQIYYCPRCGATIGRYSQYCAECSHFMKRKTERPDADTLYKELLETHSFTAISIKYGVSDKTIIKWCSQYGLPTHIKDYKPEKEKPNDKRRIRKVAQIDAETNEIINIWDNAMCAAKSLGKKKSSHITEVCNGILKTAYGFKWKYLD